VINTGNIRSSRPHIASQFSNKVMPLTDREKEARRLTRISKTANFGIDPVGGANTAMAGAGSFYSTTMSTDFLELPQSLQEKREIYRHFYNSDEIVAQAIDLHTELPLSKIRLAGPKPRTFDKTRFDSPQDYGHYILAFFERMAKKIKLTQRLVTAVLHYHLDGSIGLFAEDSDVHDVPMEVGHDEITDVYESHITDEGDAIETPKKLYVERDTRETEELEYYQKHYQGWERILPIPVDQLHIQSYHFTDKVRIELIPSDRDRKLVEQANSGDLIAQQMVEEMPLDVREHLESGQLIPLNTDPDEGSFCYMLHAKKLADEELGQSILDRCIRTLIFRDKLRQAQTQIASRAMTPKRIVWGDNISQVDVDDLRQQVDLALVDPDYSIITNYEIHWEEMGSKDRLLDLSSEYEQTERRLRTGLGVTESLLSGESLYSGDRLKLEVINQRYLFLREILQEYVEEYLFKPVARRKGFIEKDKWGDEVVLYPKLSFTRLPLRDSQDTYDALLNLYQKGSLPIELILELFNIDPDDARLKIEKDLWTVNDPMFNEVVRGVYGGLGEKLKESKEILQKVCDTLKIPMPEAPSDEGGGRFG
jgi:hypothetical protein